MILLSPLMTLALAAANVPSAPHAPAPRVAVLDDALQDLLDEYEDAVDDWQDERSAAKDARARRALKDKHPVKAFYPRFEALAKSGNGQALLWTAERIEDVLSGTSVKRGEKARQFELLTTRFRDAEWSVSTVALLEKQKRWLGDEGIRAGLRKLGESENIEAAASALASLANRLRKGQPSEEDRKESEALRDRVLRDMPDTEGARRVKEQREAQRYDVGRVAPDFTTVDTDDVEFKLSDYRGKVVVLDFWGFW